jgi:aryl-alcohol dehydrogenase-like predicted oxidoreductase
MPAAQRALGRTDVLVPAVGQGTTRTGSRASASAARDRERIDVLRLGIDLGLTFIDTAELYGGGHAEELVGRAIAGRRQRVFLASKFNPEHSAAGDLVAAAEASLRRLGTDYLDLYQMHWPEPRVPLEETLAALAALVAQGKVRHVGLGNCTLDDLAAARAVAGAPDLVSLQMEYNLFQRAPERDVLPYCRREGLTFLAYSVLDRGATLGPGRRRRVLETLAARYDATVAQIALAWVLSGPGVVALVKAASAAHLRENAAVRDLTLAPEDLAWIDDAFRQRVVYVAPERIRARSPHLPAAYASAAEARRNPRALVPAPVSVAANVARGRMLKPLPLARRTDAGDGCAYDLLDGGVLYWAWVLAKGMEEPMPAFVKGEDVAALEGAA